MIGHSTDHPAGADHKIHLSILDQVSEAITVVSIAQTAARKANPVSDKNQTTKETHFNQGTTPTRIDSRDSKEMGITEIITTGLRQEGYQPNLITVEVHQKLR